MLPALKVEKTQRGENLTIVFVDESKYWKVKGNEEQIKKNEDFKKLLLHPAKWAEYIDKSEEEDFELYQNLKADIVFIATPDYTHIKIATFWLSEDEKCKSLFIEKPIDSSLSKARVLQYYSGNKKVYALDHYLARFGTLNNDLAMGGLIGLIGGDVEEVAFYLLEDRSEAFKGPIEAEMRKSALQKGLILDLFPHILALLHNLGKVETITISKVRVGRYSYEDEEGNIKKASTSKETFAHLEFSIKSYSDKSVLVNAYIGKGISGT